MAEITLKNADLHCFFIEEDDFYLNYLDLQTGDIVDVERIYIDFLVEFAYVRDLEGETALRTIQTAIQDEPEDLHVDYDRAFQIWWETERYLLIPDLRWLSSSWSEPQVEDDELISNFVASMTDAHTHIRQILRHKIQHIGNFDAFEKALVHFPEYHQRWIAFKFAHKQQLIRNWLEPYGHIVRFI